ncbi:ankyrin repeat-containing domain protein [Achaetomium macrosporum]|uniref:Ankyrin repeat-containing domain protein n=1 Tax=Achaetomium macrosporum TaxID=79813 RepID=A0AAN7C568_9PEZI|nr:ankyrin repeat-containing domain protein [Achaetomium macrosporum]
MDMESIRAALLGRASEPRQPNHRAVKQHLLAQGLPESISKALAMNELCYWTEQEVDQVFNRMHATPDEIKDPTLPSFSINLSAAERAAGMGPSDFIKPSWEQVKESAAVLGALCVNRKGEFCVNPSAGYAALSHVWAQGLGSDAQNRGLHRSLVEQVFKKAEPLGVTWIWTDSLAIPGGGEELGFVEEEAKATLINAMADIYREAKQVIIFDSLVLRLGSVGEVEVAVALCCGRWMTRVWTYQEIKLATNAVVATRDGFVSFASIVATLRSKAHQEVGEGYDARKTGRFPGLYRTLYRLQRHDYLSVSLPDIAIGCGYREASVELDYARSLFPTLGLEWRFSDNIDMAMRKVYEAQKRHAMRLVLFHGPPRASYPGWAPAVFPGLVDSIVISPGTWKLRGMAREWLTSKVRSIVPSKPGCVILELENGQRPGAYCACNVSEATQKQSPKSVELFKEAVRSGTAYLLSDEPLTPTQPFARVGLLVERFTMSANHEGWVCLTLAIGETEESYEAVKQEWLLLHENPASDKGKQTSELNYLLERRAQPAPSGFQVENPLHAAAQKGDVNAIVAIADGPGYADLNAQDPRGWTALHYAAAAGHSSAVCALAQRRAHLAIPTADDETPVVLAVFNSHIEVVCELIEAGADVNHFAPGGPSPLVTAVRQGNVEMVKLLLALNADVSLADSYHMTPLIAAAFEGDDTDDGVLAELIGAGADVNFHTSPGLSPLAATVMQGNIRAAKMLMAHGADPNGRPPLLSPLRYAIEEWNVPMAEALLEHGAQVSGPGARFEHGWTAMMCAAASGDVAMGRLLLSRGADLYAVGGEEKWTALHVAAARGNKLFFKWVVEESKKSGHKWEELDCNRRSAFQLRAWMTQ